MLELNKHKDQLAVICSEYNVESLYVFGSASTDSLNANSDIDLLVKFKNFDIAKYFQNYMGFKSKLKSLFKREIDLLEEQTLKNPILIQSINKTKEQVYG